MPTPDEVIRRIFALQRVGTGIAREVEAEVLALFDEIVSEIMRINPTEPVRARYRRQRTEDLIRAINKLSGERFARVRKIMTDRLVRLGVIEAEWAKAGLIRMVAPDAPASVLARIGRSAVSPSVVAAILSSQPFGDPDTSMDFLAGWIRRTDEATRNRVTGAIHAGMAQAETLDDIVRRVRGRHTGRYRTVRFADGTKKRRGVFTGGAMQTTTRNAEAVVRTGVNFIANEGYLATYKQNEDVVPQVRFTATLDLRTTLICASLDGNQYATTDPDLPRPPRHFQCRSILLPIVAWSIFGVEAPEGQRASMNGLVPAGMDYDEWLRTQSKGAQIRALGPARARLFRSGMTIAEMVRADGQVLTLDELANAA